MRRVTAVRNNISSVTFGGVPRLPAPIVLSGFTSRATPPTLSLWLTAAIGASMASGISRCTLANGPKLAEPDHPPAPCGAAATRKGGGSPLQHARETSVGSTRRRGAKSDAAGASYWRCAGATLISKAERCGSRGHRACHNHNGQDCASGFRIGALAPPPTRSSSAIHSGWRRPAGRKYACFREQWLAVQPQYIRPDIRTHRP